MPPTRLPTAERQLQIADAALTIIANHGVRRLTAAALAAEVGIADGTIFRHFRNMDEIVDAAIDRFYSALAGTFPPSGGEPLELLGTFVANRLSLMRDSPELLLLAHNDRLAEAAGEQGAKRVGRVVGRSVRFVHDCLAEAQDRGQITRDTPTMILVWMVVGVVRGATTHNLHPVFGKVSLARTPPDRIWAELKKFLLKTGKE